MSRSSDSVRGAKFFILVALFVVCSASGHTAVAPAPVGANRVPVTTIEPTAVDERPPLKPPLKDPRIVVTKNERRLELFSAGLVVRRYKIGLGLSPVEDKIRQGDRRTPEGEFYVFTKNDKSAFYLSLGLSYPNIEDAERGLRDRLISRRQYDAIVRAIRRKATPPQNTALGGDIYIHGNGASSDWTWGCVALENADMKELFDAVSVGTPVTIKH
jgi:murein L,D-transpeptidase YafK